jgi:hypothetical protein
MGILLRFCPSCLVRVRIWLDVEQSPRAVNPNASAVVLDRCKSQASNSFGNESSIGENK